MERWLNWKAGSRRFKKDTVLVGVQDAIERLGWDQSASEYPRMINKAAWADNWEEAAKEWPECEESVSKIVEYLRKHEYHHAETEFVMNTRHPARTPPACWWNLRSGPNRGSGRKPSPNHGRKPSPNHRRKPSNRDTRNLYQYMGVESTASRKELKNRHKLLALKHHSDHGSGNADEMVVLNGVWSILKDSRRKAVYDEELARDGDEGVALGLIRDGKSDKVASVSSRMGWD